MPVSYSGTAITWPDSSTTTSGWTGFKNRLINGQMAIDQRNAGAAVTAGYGFSVDRWQVDSAAGTGGKVNQQQNAGSVTPPAGFNTYLGMTSTSSYSVLTGDAFALIQRIEGYNVADLGFGTANAATVTLSFKVYSSLTGTFGGAIQNGAGNRSYPFTYTISSANTWETKSVTIPGDTSGTWLKTNGTGMTVSFGLGSGSTYSGTAGAWASAYYYTATGATSVVGTNGATFYITGVQLERGSTASSFEYRPFGTELSLCQRYYETSFNYGTAPLQGGTPGTNIFAGFTGACYLSGSLRLNTIYYAVAKRASPTVTFYRPASTWAGTVDGRWSAFTGSWVASSSTNVTDSFSGTSGFGVDMAVSGTSAAGAYICMGGWASSAEL